MKEIDAIKGIDVYLLDQLIKGRIDEDSAIFDAGCGSGRNIHYLLRNGFNVKGCDIDSARIEILNNLYSSLLDRFASSKIEDYTSSEKFDFIICNAVLHFAENEKVFTSMFSNLVKLLNEKGILFVRTATNIGLTPSLIPKKNSMNTLPDGSSRYLITREDIARLGEAYGLSLIEPVKTTNVDEMRAMTTIVWQKD